MFAASVRKAAYVRTVDMPPPRSLGRLRSGRETAAGGSCSHGTGHHTGTGSGMNAQRQKRKKKEPRKRPRRSRFSIGSASPWRASHFLKLSSLGLGETRCGFRITAVSVGQPPPAASTFPPYRLPDTLPPFSLAGLVALSHSSRAFLLCGISGDLGSSLQAWL